MSEETKSLQPTHKPASKSESATTDAATETSGPLELTAMVTQTRSLTNLQVENLLSDLVLRM
jgi:hypothetical protein